MATRIEWLASLYEVKAAHIAVDTWMGKSDWLTVCGRPGKLQYNSAKLRQSVKIRESVKVQ